MIKALFFDWFQTLARFEPPREEVQSQAYRESGISVPPEKLARGLQNADKDWFEEGNRLAIDKRTPQELVELSLRYQNIALAEAGVTVPREEHLRIAKRIQQRYKDLSFVLYDDVLPALRALKERRFTLGVLTNASRDIFASSQFGFEPYIDFVVTSAEVGSNKPEPPIFLRALEQAGVNAAEAVHVGDQYHLDVTGARRVGISPVLIDRYGFYPEITDCPVIHTLSELNERL